MRLPHCINEIAELDRPWVPVFGDTHHKDWDKYRLPPGSRHGCMLPISMS
ncbi:hypothetical protein [Crateriforma conspicua]|nr:hypothetical protein [Crateriforma conspicua]